MHFLERNGRQIGRDKFVEFAERRIEPARQRIAEIVRVELHRLGDKHRGAADRRAVFLREVERGLPEQEDPARTAFGLTRNPEAVFVAADEKQRNRLA